MGITQRRDGKSAAKDPAAGTSPRMQFQAAYHVFESAADAEQRQDSRTEEDALQTRTGNGPASIASHSFALVIGVIDMMDSRSRSLSLCVATCKLRTSHAQL